MSTVFPTVVIINYHILRGLKILIYYIIVLVVRCPTWVSKTVLPSGRFRRESISLLILIIDRFYFLAVVGMKSPIPCWLSAKGHSRFLETAPIPWFMTFHPM